MPQLFDKLQKMIAHERSARAVGSLQEAEAFAERIASMLSEHKLSMTEIEFERQDTVDPIGDSGMELVCSMAGQWVDILATGVSQSFYCQVLRSESGRKSVASIAWAGRASDRAAAIEMFQYLAALGQQFANQRVAEMEHKPQIMEMRRLARHEHKDVRRKVERTIRKTFNDWTKDYLFGFACALHKRLAENRSRLEAADHGTGLVIRDQLAIERYVNEKFVRCPNVQLRATKTKFKGAIAEGWQRGNEVSTVARSGLGSGT